MPEIQLRTFTSAAEMLAARRALRARLNPPLRMPPAPTPPPGMPSPPAECTLDGIVRAVARYFAVDPDEIRGPSRVKDLVLYRHLAIGICRVLTTKSTPALARYFGGRDHTTIMHACRRMEALLASVLSSLGSDASIDVLVEECAKHPDFRSKDRPDLLEPAAKDIS